MRPPAVTGSLMLASARHVGTSTAMRTAAAALSERTSARRRLASAMACTSASSRRPTPLDEPSRSSSSATALSASVSASCESSGAHFLLPGSDFNFREPPAARPRPCSHRVASSFVISSARARCSRDRTVPTGIARSSRRPRSSFPAIRTTQPLRDTVRAATRSPRARL